MKKSTIRRSSLFSLALLFVVALIFLSSTSLDHSESSLLVELANEVKEMKSEINHLKSSAIPQTASADPFIGEVVMFAGNFAPRGWAFCEGQLLPISEYTALFSLLGTTYGGDGRTTFALPDLRGRSPIGVGGGPGLFGLPWGKRGGAETVVLEIANLPTHNHPIPPSMLPVYSSPSRSLNYLPGVNSLVSVGHRANTQLEARTRLQTSPSGSNKAIDIRNPCLSMHFIIALEGIFPSRS